MRRLNFIIAILLLSSVSWAQNYSVDWYVIASGGEHSESGSYQIDGTIGQAITGLSSSPNYSLESGFWVGLPAVAGGCVYAVGDVNGSNNFNGLDITYGVAYLKGGNPPVYECECTSGNIWFVSGDINASCSYNGLDVTYGVNYLKGGPGLNPCADCPPGGGLLAGPYNRNTYPARQPRLKSDQGAEVSSTE